MYILIHISIYVCTYMYILILIYLYLYTYTYKIMLIYLYVYTLIHVSINVYKRYANVVFFLVRIEYEQIPPVSNRIRILNEYKI